MDNFKIRTKLGIIYIICVLLPMFVTDFLFVQMVTADVTTEEARNMEDVLERISYELTAKVNSVVSISDYLYMNERLNEFLEYSYGSPAEYYEAFEQFSNDSVIRYYYTAESIFHIQICTDNPGIVSGSYFCSREEVKDSVWYQKYLQNEEKIFILAYYEEDNFYEQSKNQARHISLIRKMDNFGGDAVMKIDFDYEMLESILDYDILDADIYVSDGEKIILQPGAERKKDYPLLNKTEEKQLSVQEDVPVVGDIWKAVITKEQYSAYKILKGQRSKFAALLLINLILPSVLIVMIDRSFKKRLLLTEEYIRKTEQGQFEVIPGNPGNDEIGRLIRSFNLMVLKIKELIEVVYKKEAEQKTIEVAKNRAELDALKRQINPHFMYNALESIRMHSLVKGEKETAEMIGKFAALLRQVTYWKEDFIEVKEEMSVVCFYLEIQKNRFGRRLEYTVYVQPEAEKQKLPRFLVMTFVENACIHGIETQMDGGSISVNVTSDDDYIYIEVIDSGAGMEEEELKTLRKQIQGASWKELKGSEHIGVLNSVIRLRMYYHENMEFEIDSGKGKGTEIFIRIPQEKGEEEEYVESNAGR